MATWEQVRDEWSKAEQMGYQSVLQAAHVGEMLIELKAETPRGEFKNRTRAVLQGASNDTGERLMTLARHLPLLREKQPDSQRKALEIIKAQQPQKPRAIPSPKPDPEPEQPEDEEMKFDTGLILVLTGLSAGTGGSSLNIARKELTDRFGADMLQTKDQYLTAAKQLAAEKKCSDRFKDEQKFQEEVEKLSKQSQLQLAKAESALLKRLEADFDRRVREAADAMIPDRVRIYEELSAKADAARTQFYARSSGIGAYVTQEDYRILRSFFHSDKTPSDEQKNKAFHIVQKIGEYVKAAA